MVKGSGSGPRTSGFEPRPASSQICDLECITCLIFKNRKATKGGKPQWGGDGGVLNWAIGIDMYTLMCIKLMTDKNLQYKQTNKQK